MKSVQKIGCRTALKCLFDALCCDHFVVLTVQEMSGDDDDGEATLVYQAISKHSEPYRYLGRGQEVQNAGRVT